MMTIRKPIAACRGLIVMTLAAFVLTALAPTAPLAAQEAPREIGWDDLLPQSPTGGRVAPTAPAADEVMPLFDDMGAGGMEGPPVQKGSFDTDPTLDGQLIRMPGFVLPLEYSANRMVSEFLLVPYFGACIHVPPPPPNQTVYVTADEPVKIERMWDPVWITGIMRVRTSYTDLADASYTLEFRSFEPYEY